MNPLNKLIVKTIPLFPRKLVRLFADNYIAGETLMNAVEKVKFLNSKNIIATTDVLGESITTKEEAVKSKDEDLLVLEAIDKYKLNSNVSIKLTMLGLKIDYNLCLSLFTEIVECAKSFNNFVRIDMEESAVTDGTIRIFEDIRIKYNNVGIVLQAYLRRTESDVMKLTETKTNFRLCKGIYIEPEKIAFKKKQEIRDNFLKVLRLMFERKSYVGIATHDKHLVEGSKKIINELDLKQNDYEFQMLLGVTEKLRDKIVAEGHRMRVYVPFGERWYEYSTRRFKENPNVAGAVLKSIILRK